MVGFLYWFFYFDIMFFFMSPCLCGKLNNHISTNRFAMAYRPEIAGFQPSRIECCWHWVTSSPKPNTWYSKIRCKNIIVLPKKYDHNLKYTPKLHMSLAMKPGNGTSPIYWQMMFPFYPFRQRIFFEPWPDGRPEMVPLTQTQLEPRHENKEFPLFGQENLHGALQKPTWYGSFDEKTMGIFIGNCWKLYPITRGP